MIIENLRARKAGEEKISLVVLMSGYKPCAFTFLDDINELSSCDKRGLSLGKEAVKSCGKIHFESRKKRPYERGKKKRRKGKRDPLSLLCTETRDRVCNFKHFPD